jgi:YVTN family beta-propeller protein
LTGIGAFQGKVIMSNRFRNFMQWVSLSAVLVFGAGAAGAQTLAYVANFNSQDVSVIDTASNTVIATIPLGAGPTGLAGTPDGAFVYVANGPDVTVIDTATNAVVATVGLLGTSSDVLAVDVAITPDGAFAYVPTNRCSPFACAPEVNVIDTATNSVVATFPVGAAGLRLHEIAITPNGAFAYVAGGSGGTFVIDTATNTVTTTIPGFAEGVAIAPNGAFAYVTTGFLFNQVSVIDTATNTVTATIPVPSAYRVEITPNSAFAYVTQDSAASAVTVIDTATNTPVATIGTGTAADPAITPDGAFVYVPQPLANVVSVIDTATNTVVATIPVGISPQDVAIVGPPAPSGPTSVDQCKNGGWMTFTNPTFKNQGDCVSYVHHL